jgi:hypothetical protein
MSEAWLAGLLGAGIGLVVYGLMLLGIEWLARRNQR